MESLFYIAHFTFMYFYPLPGDGRINDKKVIHITNKRTFSVRELCLCAVDC